MSKEIVDCLICRAPSDSEEVEGHPRMTRRQVQDGIRLDRLMLHFKAKHTGEFPSKGISLLDMGFTLHNTPIDVDADQGIEETA
jgi:hypothetical protein